MKRSWPLLVSASLVLSLAVPLLHGGLVSLEVLRAVPVREILLLLGMIVLAWLCNAARIRLLAGALGRRLARRDAFAIVVASEFAGVATPAGAGCPATYVLLLSRHGLPVSSGAAVVAVDSAVDLIFFGTALPVVAVLVVADGNMASPLRLLGLMSVLAVLGSAALFFLLSNGRALAGACALTLCRWGWLQGVRFRLLRGLLRFRRSARLLAGMGAARLGLLYFYCLLHWLLRYSVLPLVLLALGKSLSWGYLFAMQGLLLFVGQATFLPGGGGGVELGFSALLAPHLDAGTTAAALLLWRFVTFYWYLLAGAPVFALVASQLGDLARTPSP